MKNHKLVIEKKIMERAGKHKTVRDLLGKIAVGDLLGVYYFGFRFGKIVKIFPRKGQVTLAFYTASTGDYTDKKRFSVDIPVESIYRKEKGKRKYTCIWKEVV
ncbi:MAG: hypothetical protein QW531_04880 [Thermoplasmata archaeon]